MTMGKKIILNENSEKAESEIKKIRSFCTKVNPILPEFLEENGYQLDLNDIEDLLYKNDLDHLINKVNTSIENGLTGIQITGVIRKTFTSKTAEFVYGFAKKLQAATIGYKNIDVKRLSLIDGALILEKENEEKIKESFQYFIESDLAISFYEKHKAVAESLSGFSVFIKNNTKLRYIFIQQIADLFELDNKTGKITISPNVGYESCINK